MNPVGRALSLSFWQTDAPPFEGASRAGVEGEVDVAIIGAGFTGLSAALALAGDGARVAVLEAGDVIGAASGRNGGQCNAGTAHDFGDLATTYGVTGACALYRAHCEAVESVATLVREEAIDCDFRRCGRAKLAAKPQHFAKLERAHALLVEHVDREVTLVPPEQIRSEIGSDSFHGALVQHASAQLHPGKFGRGLAQAAVRRGATIWENAPVRDLRRTPDGWSLFTPRGRLSARQVIVATGGNSPYPPYRWFSRRIVSVGSFIVATAPLEAGIAQRLFPKRRNYVTSRVIGNYFRLTADNRLVFGGRARFARSNPASDAKSGRVLVDALHAMFPELAEVPVEYYWGGTIDLTADRLPRAGEHEGLYYAMGYSGHGVQMATHMGQCLARMVRGDEAANPLAFLGWPAIPGHVGKPWFLPVAGAWYRIQDRLH